MEICGFGWETDPFCWRGGDWGISLLCGDCHRFGSLYSRVVERKWVLFLLLRLNPLRNGTFQPFLLELFKCEVLNGPKRF